MRRYLETFVIPLLRGKRWKRICEIGASLGDGTDLLAALPDVRTTVVDPCLDCDLADRYASNARVSVKKGISLEVLPTINEPFDCMILDGDHNWYTVYEELRTIASRNLLRPGGFLFLHDVVWPWGRRDMYYQPEMIPEEYRHPWKQHGLVRGRSEQSEHSTKLDYFKKATHEGGPRNGVMTAVEDFLRDNPGKYRFFHVSAGAGLGVIQYNGGFADYLTFLSMKIKGLACEVALLARRPKD